MSHALERLARSTTDRSPWSGAVPETAALGQPCRALCPRKSGLDLVREAGGVEVARPRPTTMLFGVYQRS